MQRDRSRLGTQNVHSSIFDIGYKSFVFFFFFFPHADFFLLLFSTLWRVTFLIFESRKLYIDYDWKRRRCGARAIFKRKRGPFKIDASILVPIYQHGNRANALLPTTRRHYAYFAIRRFSILPRVGTRKVTDILWQTKNENNFSKYVFSFLEIFFLRVCRSIVCRAFALKCEKLRILTIRDCVLVEFYGGFLRKEVFTGLIRNNFFIRRLQTR